MFLLLSPSYLYLSSWVHNGPAWLWLFSDCPPNPVSPYLTGCHQPCNQHQPVKPSDLYCSNISPGRCLTVSYCVLLLDPGQHTVCFPSDPENDGAWRSPSKCPALCALNAQNYQLIKSEMSLMSQKNILETLRYFKSRDVTIFFVELIKSVPNNEASWWLLSAV